MSLDAKGGWGGRKEGWMDGKKKKEEGGRKMEWREMGWILSIRSRVALDGGMEAIPSWATTSPI